MTEEQAELMLKKMQEMVELLTEISFSLMDVEDDDDDESE